MKRIRFFTLIAVVAAFSLVAACANPDSDARFDDYQSYVGTGIDASASGNYCPGALRDISGTYFMRIEHSISPEDNILMQLDAVKTGDSVYTLTFQPLKTDMNKEDEPRSDARAPAGDPIVIPDVGINAAGMLEVSLKQLSVSGEANSLTWGKILADIDLTLVACAGQDDFLCGDGPLEVYEPTRFKGQSVTFGATKIDGDVTTSDTTPSSCGLDEDEDATADEDDE